MASDPRRIHGFELVLVIGVVAIALGVWWSYPGTPTPEWRQTAVMALSVILLIGYSIRSHRRLEEAERRYLEHANQGMAPAEGHPETQSSRTQRSG